jgi:hypothetical protein
VAFIDLRRNTLRFSEKSRFIEPVDNLIDSVRNARGALCAGVRNFSDYAAGFLGLKRASDPFGYSMGGSIGAFYEAWFRRRSVPTDIRDACAIFDACARVAQHANALAKGELACARAM